MIANACLDSNVEEQYEPSFPLDYGFVDKYMANFLAGLTLTKNSWWGNIWIK